MQLNDSQLQCLKQIGREGGGGLLSPCAEAVLLSLLQLGLIEPCSPRWLPLQQCRSGY